MADPVDAVLGLLGAPDRLDELVTALGELDDRGRRKISTRVRSLAEQVRWNDDSRAVSLAALGCVTGVRQLAAALDAAPIRSDQTDLAVRVLAEREPHWLTDLAAALLVRSELPEMHFQLVRALVREGAVARPEFPEYLEAMAAGLGPDLPPFTVLDQLRADPDLLDDELWDLLATERVGRRLTNHDNFHLKPQHWGTGEPPPPSPEATWQYALTALAADGALDRQRLIEAALGAFFRDWAAVDVTWFVGLHGVLAPTEPELVARQATYSRLLAAEHGPVVKLGLSALRMLLAGGDLDVDLLVASAPAALARSDKGTVSTTLGLLSDVAAAQPKSAERIAEVVATAVQHERVDVQERAIALLTRLVPNVDQRQQLLDPYTAGLAPSVRPPSAAPVRVEQPPEHVWAKPDPAVVPVRGADELGELFARLIEEADDPAEIERLLEGVLRLARERPRNGAHALVRRAEELLGGYYPGAWSGEEPRADLAALALVWLRGASPGRGFLGRDHRWESGFQTVRRLVSPPRLGRGSSLSELLTRRTHEVAAAVRAGGGISLSFPTTRDGSLTAADLARRVSTIDAGARVLPLDACIALLRVPPQEREQLHLPTSPRAGRFLRDQLRALQELRPTWQLVVDREERQQRDPRHSARPTRVAWRTAAQGRALDGALLAAVDRSDPRGTFGPEAADGEYAARFEQVTAQWPQLLPHDPDLLAAHAHPRLYRGLIQNRSGSEPLLEFLGRSARPVGPPVLSALLLGLSAKNGSERARAVDAVIDLAGRSMLDGAGLGRVLAQLLVAEAVVGSRVAQAMTETARAEPQAGEALLGCLAGALDALVGRRDAHLYIDLLAQLAIAQGREVTLPEVFVAAAVSSSKSQLARACRRVPRHDAAAAEGPSPG